MKNMYFFTTVFAIVILTGCSASKKAFKQAREYEEAGLFVEAAEQYLNALRKDPNFKEAKVHLIEVAPRAYDELMTRAKNLEDAENWDQVVSEYSRLDKLINGFNRHGVVIETVNVAEHLKKAKRKAAEFHYSNAEEFFSQKRWRKAANAYLKAHDYVDKYKRSFDKAIQSLLNSGNRWLAEEDFSQALESYHKILEVASNHPVATKKIAESHYLLGKQYFKEGQYREAFVEFELTQEFVADFRDVADWTERAYENAVQYIAIFPFLNRTSLTVDGYLIASDILTRVTHANLKFAEFLSHPETISLLSQSRIATRYGRISETELLKIASKEGLNSFVWGTVQDIDVKDWPERFTEYEHERVIVVQDSAGKDIEETDTIFFREYLKKRRVRVKLEYTILDTETGRILDRQRFTEEINDVAKWISYQGSIYDLPEDKRHLLDAPRDPRPVPILINEMLASVTEEISREVIRFYK